MFRSMIIRGHKEKDNKKAWPAVFCIVLYNLTSFVLQA